MLADWNRATYTHTFVFIFVNVKNIIIIFFIFFTCGCAPPSRSEAIETRSAIDRCDTKHVEAIASTLRL